MNSSWKSPLEESSRCSAFCVRDTALDLSVREARASLGHSSNCSLFTGIGVEHSRIICLTRILNFRMT